MMQLKHWQDAVNAVLGVWLVLSPWAMGYMGEIVPMWSAILIGLALLAAALGAMLMPRAWEEWTEAVLGLLLIAAPWVLGFEGVARMTSLGTGIVVLLLAAWTLATDKEYSAWWRERKAAQ